MPTETCIHRNFTQTCLHYRAQDDSQMRRGGLCVYNIDVWCSHTVKADGQCFPDVKLLKCLCLFLCTLLAVYMFCNLCSMKESTLCCVMTNKLPCFLFPVVYPGYCYSLATLTWNLFCDGYTCSLRTECASQARQDGELLFEGFCLQCLDPAPIEFA